MKLIKFYATWCGPCKSLTAMLEDMDLPYEVQEVDIDKDMDTALKFGVRSVPTLLLVNDFDEVKVNHVGLPPSKEVLIDKFTD